MRNMIPSRSVKRSNNVPNGKQSKGTFEAPFKPPDTNVPVAPVTSSGLCSENIPLFASAPEHCSWNLSPVYHEPNANYLTPCTTPLSIETDDEDPVPVRSEHDPSLHVVVKNGYTFYIRYVDEPSSEQPVVQNPSQGTDFGEVESLPSISSELSVLMDDSMLPEGAISTLEPNEGSPRDWINYDELPLLTQQKQQQPVRTDHVSPPNDTLDHRSKTCHSALVKPMQLPQANDTGCSGCEMFPAQNNPLQPSLGEFAQNNDTVLMKSIEPNVATTVPDFSHYCVECEKFFPSNDRLQEHMESNHRMFDEAQISMTSTPKASFNRPAVYGSGALVWPCTAIVDSTNQCRKRQFFCDSCNISFDFVESYYMHNHSVHGGEGGVGSGYR